MMWHLLEHETPSKLLRLSDVARGLYEGCELVVGDGVLVDTVPPGKANKFSRNAAVVKIHNEGRTAFQVTTFAKNNIRTVTF